MSLTDVIRRWWPLLVLAALIAGAAGLGASTQMSPRYEASTRLLVGPVAADFDTGRAATTNVVTYGELATSQPVVQATIDQVGLDLSIDEFLERVTVEADSTSRIITITATDADPDRAAAIAEAMGAELEALAPPADEAPAGAVSVVSPAVTADDPIWPTPLMVVALSALGGLAAALIAVVLIESVRREAGERERAVSMRPADESRPARSSAASRRSVRAAQDSPRT